MKKYENTYPQKQLRAVIVNPWIDAICANCKGSGIQPSAISTQQMVCSYCDGRGVVKRR